MDDLLKDAIADAKAVRETALENAKIALEEAFTPRLQSMLSKKIQSEMEHEDEDDVEEMRGDDEEEMEERGSMRDNDEDPTDDHSEAMHDDEDDVEEMRGDDEDDEPKMDMESVIEIDGVKYAPVVSEEEDEEDEEEMEESDDFDLDEILKELEEEEDEDDEMDESKEDEVTEGEHEDDDKEDVDEEVDATTGIGSSDNKKGSADKSSGIGSKDKAKFESVEVTEEKDEDDMDEDIDLEEIVKALSEEEDEEEKKDENSKLQSELDEHRNVVKYLRSKLNEVNLLNAKLLFTNKLFRSHGLSNDQKMKVVETFDRAHNLREVKLVYSTLAESFGSKQTKTEIKESKGSASKPVASTKSEKQEVIAEGHEMRDRFKKLAGIL
jgi:hypothetical protein